MGRFRYPASEHMFGGGSSVGYRIDLARLCSSGLELGSPRGGRRKPKCWKNLSGEALLPSRLLPAQYSDP